MTYRILISNISTEILQNEKWFRDKVLEKEKESIVMQLVWLNN